MNDRRRSTAALGALIIVAAVGMFVTALPTGSPVTPKGSAVNELDVDLAAGTPMPPLPTVQPDGMSIVSADQALARGLRGMFHAVRPKLIAVRLVDNGILNRLCGDQGGGTFPEDEQVWAVAFTQDGLTQKDIAGPFYDRHPPDIFLTRYPGEPSPTPRLTPTPYPAAGGLIVLVAGAGFVTYELALVDGAADAQGCPTFEQIRALASLNEQVSVLPTSTIGPPVPTPCVPDLVGMDVFTATMGMTGTMALTSTRSYTDGP